jgi:glycerol-3-phosphate dehydrogenase
MERSDNLPMRLIDDIIIIIDAPTEHLEVLKKRGDTNGVQFLRIIDQDELRRIEPSISRDAVAALYSPEAGM